MIKAKHDDPSVLELVKQIEGTRNLDIETSKPRLQKASQPPDLRHTEQTKKDSTTNQPTIW